MHIVKYEILVYFLNIELIEYKNIHLVPLNKSIKSSALHSEKRE